MAIEYLTGLNAIVMKAIWNIEKRQGRVTIQDLVEEIKRNTGKEYHRNSVSTYLRRLEKKDFIETKKEGRRSFIYSKVDESDYHKVQFEQMKKVWFDDSWNEFSAALSDVVKQEESDKLRRLLDDMDDWADFHLYSGISAESVKLTSLLTKTYDEAYLCRDGNKIIIDINQT